MTTRPSWQEAYNEQRQRCEKLKVDVDRHLQKAHSNWHAASRVKEPESFYQKIETGRVKDPSKLEDFFAAMVVVPLPGDISAARRFVESFFEVDYRRPESDTVASQPASTFVFNDLRLFGHLKSDDTLPSSELEQITFEIQIKTFFQHAWSTATHDLVYKHSEFSWMRSRVSAQVKASLEQAELSISSIEVLEKDPVLVRDGEPENTLNQVSGVVRRNWNDSDLPRNRRRTIETLSTLIKSLKLSVDDLENLLDRGRFDLSGHPEGWSVYQCVVDYASRYHAGLLSSALCKPPGRRPTYIHVTEEVLARLNLDIERCPRALL